MMDNLPIGSSISGNQIFHEGNHDHRGNPHKQYIKIDEWDFTESNGTNPSLSYELFDVTWQLSTNYRLHYVIDLKIKDRIDLYQIDLTLTNLGVDGLYYTRDSSFQILAKYENLGKLNNQTLDTGKLIVYIRFFNNYKSVSYRLNSAVTEKLQIYPVDKSYAFKCYSSHHGNSLDSSLVNSNIIPTIRLQTVLGSATFEGADIPINASRQIEILGNFTSNSIITYSMTNIGGGLVPTVALVGEGKFTIFVNNVRNQIVRMPECTINYKSETYA